MVCVITDDLGDMDTWLMPELRPEGSSPPPGRALGRPGRPAPPGRPAVRGTARMHGTRLTDAYDTRACVSAASMPSSPCALRQPPPLDASSSGKIEVQVRMLCNAKEMTMGDRVAYIRRMRYAGARDAGRRHLRAAARRAAAAGQPFVFCVFPRTFDGYCTNQNKSPMLY